MTVSISEMPRHQSFICTVELIIMIEDIEFCSDNFLLSGPLSLCLMMTSDSQSQDLDCLDHYVERS